MNSVLPGNSDPVGANSWSSPPETLRLPEGQVHVWRIGLDSAPVALEILRKTLSSDEKERAGRFRFDRDQQAFIVRRGWLRFILGRYLEQDPASLQFSYNPYGRPFLQSETAGQLYFNLSHSQGLALFVFARQVEIGVDIERERSDFDCFKLAERFFSARERAELNALPVGSRSQAFFLGWTRKEAFIKAHGEGLSLPLDHFDVSLGPGEPARLVATRMGLEAPDQWSLFNLEPAPGYLAALAVRSRWVELHCWAM
jgi:4'-phosphopantetheinyl transferase